MICCTEICFVRVEIQFMSVGFKLLIKHKRWVVVTCKLLMLSQQSVVVLACVEPFIFKFILVFISLSLLQIPGTSSWRRNPSSVPQLNTGPECSDMVLGRRYPEALWWSKKLFLIQVQKLFVKLCHKHRSLVDTMYSNVYPFLFYLLCVVPYEFGWGVLT